MAETPENTSPDAMVPAPAAPSVSDTAMQQAAPLEASAAAASRRAAELASAPLPTPAPVPHARLLSMIQGLATGLGAAATSIATHGERGGAEEVAAQQQAEAQRKLQIQAQNQALRNQQIQQQILVADTNHKLAQNIVNMATLPDQIAKSHLEVVGAKQAQAESLANFQAAHGGMGPEEFSTELGRTTPATAQTGPGGAPSFFVTSAQQQLDAAKAAKTLSPDDTFVKNLETVLSNPQATPKDLWVATSQLDNQLKLQEKATQARTQAEESAAKARTKDLNEATGKLAQAEQAYKDDPTPETVKARDEAKATQKVFEDEEQRKKQIDQDVQQGDPKVVGEMMADGLYAPKQVLNARSMSRPFYSKVIAAADARAKAQGKPEIMDENGKPTGHYFNAEVADAQDDYAKNARTQDVLNKIRTLNEPGGDFEIARAAITALPKLDSATINKVFNVAGKEFGSAAVTNYHMAIYNLATLLANVQIGGVPTDTQIQHEMDLMKDSFSAGQFEGALRTAQKDLSARGKAIIGINPFLRAAFPDLVKAAGQHQPGDRIRLKDGREGIIDAINPDGTVTFH